MHESCEQTSLLSLFAHTTRTGHPIDEVTPTNAASHQCQKDMWCNLLYATETKYCFSQGQSLNCVICDKDIYIKRRICIKLYLAVTLNQMQEGSLTT